MAQDPVTRLRHLIAARKVVFLVGAGVSMQVTGNDPSSSWVGFMERGITLACQQAATWTDVEGWSAQALEDVRSGDPDRRLAAEDSLLARLGEWNEHGVEQWLQESVGSLSIVDRSPVEALAALGAPLLTLNYDNLLEEISGRPAVTWQQPPAMRQVVLGEEQGIIHLHGQWREPSSVVLGSARYLRIGSEQAAETLVSSLSNVNVLVLVGFGAPLDTVQFEPLRRWLTTSSGPSHYRLVAATELSRFSSPRYVEEHRHLQLVEYGDCYDDLAPFLRSLQPRTEVGWRRHLGRASFVPVLLVALAIFSGLGVVGISAVGSAIGTAFAVLMLAEIFVRDRRTPARAFGLVVATVVAVVLGITAASTRSPTAKHDASPVTQVEFFRTQNLLSKRPILRVTAHARGQCGDWSLADPGGVPEAHRCFSGNNTYDPCFATDNEAECIESPWATSIVIFSYDREVHAPRGGKAPRRQGNNPQAPPWALELEDGERCLLATGLEPPVADLSLTYQCNNGVIFGRIDHSGRLWRVLYKAATATTSITASIRFAWY